MEPEGNYVKMQGLELSYSKMTIFMCATQSSSNHIESAYLGVGGGVGQRVGRGARIIRI